MERIRSTIGIAGIVLLLLCTGIALCWWFRGLSYTANVATIIGVIVGALALILFLWVQRTMGPRIELKLGDRVEAEQPSLNLKYAFLHLAVVNHPLTGWLERQMSRIWRVERRHATCEVELSFLSKEESQVYIKSIPADWSRTPEPLAYFYDYTVHSVKLFPDPTRKAARWILDVHPTGRGEAVAVAVKHEGQKESYAFNSESYFGSATGKPWCLERYRLDSEEVIVSVCLITGGNRLGPYRFLLVNRGTTIDEDCFRLEALP